MYFKIVYRKTVEKPQAKVVQKVYETALRSYLFATPVKPSVGMNFFPEASRVVSGGGVKHHWWCSSLGLDGALM